MEDGSRFVEPTKYARTTLDEGINWINGDLRYDAGLDDDLALVFSVHDASSFAVDLKV